MEGVAGCGEAVDAVQVVAVEEEEDTTSALDDQILVTPTLAIWLRCC